MKDSPHHPHVLQRSETRVCVCVGVTSCCCYCHCCVCVCLMCGCVCVRVCACWGEEGGVLVWVWVFERGGGQVGGYVISRRMCKYYQCSLFCSVALFAHEWSLRHSGTVDGRGALPLQFISHPKTTNEPKRTQPLPVSGEHNSGGV